MKSFPLEHLAVTRRVAVFWACIAAATCLPNAVRGEQPPAADVAFFETRIRPILVQHCYECHSADAAKVGGKLWLDSRDGILTGGESGPALAAGKPDESLLMQAIRYDGLEMPPDQPLPEQVVQDFANWIQRGAVDPRTNDAAKTLKATSPPVELWSLDPIQMPPVPEVQLVDWPRDPLDHFILEQLEARNLLPNDDADPRVLVRRLHYDLTGLPPTIEEIAEFAAACNVNRQAAVEQLVDDLLARPQFGERWGRAWLDVARYGESNGNDGLGRNPTFPHAWRYRDYVIAAFNADVPFNQFITEQLAGDLLPSESPEQRDRQLVATGFLALTAKPAKAMNTNFEMDVVADQIDVVGRGIMGISVACARCHDHKFDPIPTRDYYALAGIFSSSETLWGVAGHESLTAPATDLHVLESASKVLPPDDFVETVIVLESNTGKPKAIPKSKWPPGTPLAMGVRERKTPADCQVNINGDAKKLGDAVPRGYLTACSEELAARYPIDTDQSGRLQLAQWLTSEQHPLTSRVYVNRVWQQLFGLGIVSTPDDFGLYGERPTHPELLDHLATRFMADGWSTKRLVRSLVLSRTYQLSSHSRSELLQADPENRLWTRHRRRRLDAEAIRDSILSATGQLDLSPGDGSIIRHRDILVNLAGNLHQPSNKRSLYLCYLRSSPPPELAPFDLPDFTSVTGQREANTLPAQALHFYNSPFVIDQAESLMTLVTVDTPDAAERVRLGFGRILGRLPTEDELRQSLELVQLTKSDLNSEEKAWASLFQALLMTSEFRYVD